MNNVKLYRHTNFLKNLNDNTGNLSNEDKNELIKIENSSNQNQKNLNNDKKKTNNIKKPISIKISNSDIDQENIEIKNLHCSTVTNADTKKSFYISN